MRVAHRGHTTAPGGSNGRCGTPRPRAPRTPPDRLPGARVPRVSAPIRTPDRVCLRTPRTRWSVAPCGRWGTRHRCPDRGTSRLAADRDRRRRPPPRRVAPSRPRRAATVAATRSPPPAAEFARVQSTCAASEREWCVPPDTVDTGTSGTNYPSCVARRHTPQTRVRDSDRAHTCARLDAAHADGHLTTADHRDLHARARSATTLRELAELVRDVPAAGTAAAADRPSGSRLLRITVAGVTLVAAAAVVWLVLPARGTPPAGSTSAPTVATVTTGPASGADTSATDTGPAR
mgnify:CR=1 FL=1